MTSDPNNSIKAHISSVFFLIVGIICFTLFYNPSNAATIVPIFIFYIAILVNTFFSIRLFVKITPSENSLQKICDAVLAILYVAMAVNMGTPFNFVFFDALLFTVATVKYVLLSQIAPYPKLLRRKILVDLSGIVLGLLTLGGVIEGYASASLWAFAIIFVVANILLFFVWPLYHLRHDA